MTYQEALIDLQSICKGHGGLYTDDSPAWELAFDALKKQITMKPVLNGKPIVLHFDGSKSTRKLFTCPNNHNIPVVCREGEMPYCPFCGQRLNWRDEE